MTTYKKWMIVLIILMLGLTSVVIWTIQERFFKQDLLPIGEAAQKVESLYGGSVESFEQKENLFYMQLERKGLTYNLQIDGRSGDLIKITKVKTETKHTATVKTVEEVRSLLISQNKGEIISITLRENLGTPQYIVETSSNETKKTIVVDAKTGKIISEKAEETIKSPKPTLPAVISKEKAIEIAQSELSGNLTSVAFHETSDGGYYLVEIKDSDMDATFQIHAVSGKLLSVTQTKQPTKATVPQRTDDDDDDDTEDQDDDSDKDDDDTNDDDNDDDN